MEKQNNYINLKYNEKFQIELIVNSNSLVEDVYNKIQPLGFFFKNIFIHIHSLINVFYTLLSIFFIYNISPLINKLIYQNFDKIEYLNKIDYFYVCLPLIIMALIEIFFNNLIKDRFYNKDNKIFNELKSLVVSMTCKFFFCILCVYISNNNLYKFKKYFNNYMYNIPIEKTKDNNKKIKETYRHAYRATKYINYKWYLINYIYISAFILNFFLHFFLSRVYETKKKEKYTYIKNQLTEFYTKNGLVNNLITNNIYKELFN